jgi:hypothetical protein
MMKRRPNPYQPKPKLVACAIRKLAADLAYRTPAIDPDTGRLRPRRPLRYAILERAQAEAVLRILKGRSRTSRKTGPHTARRARCSGSGRHGHLSKVQRAGLCGVT